MATDTLPAPSRSDTEIGDVDHYWCCEENVAMCGADLTGVPPRHEFDADCPLCVYAEAEGMPCPVPGCRP